MSVEPSELVVVLGPAGTTVLDVGTAAEVLAHVAAHVANHATDPHTQVPGPRPPVRGHRAWPVLEGLPFVDGVPVVETRPVEVGEPRRLRFYRAADGELLHLRLLADWWTFDLEESGESIGAQGLEDEVHALFAAAQPEVAQVTAQSHQLAPQLPPPGTWSEQLDEIRDLLVDHPHHFHDRRGWAHNFFVHGWT